MRNVSAELEYSDVLQYAFNLRPGSGYSVQYIPSTSFYVTIIPQHPIGGCCFDSKLPEHIKKVRNCLQKWLTPTRDNKCFFRCLAYHRYKHSDIFENKVDECLSSWYKSEVEPFPGVLLDQLWGLEDHFKINIDVFHFPNPETLQIRWRSEYRHEGDTMQLLLVENTHFMYITDLNHLAKSFTCHKCGKLWNTYKNFNRHFEKCNGDYVNTIYPGGKYMTPPSTLTRLKFMGVPVPELPYTYKYRAAFDFETSANKDDRVVEKSTATTVYESRAELLSIGLAHNLPPPPPPPFPPESTDDTDNVVMTDAITHDTTDDTSQATTDDSRQTTTDDTRDSAHETSPGMTETTETNLKISDKCYITDGDPQALVDTFIDDLERLSDIAYEDLKHTDFKEAFDYIEHQKKKPEHLQMRDLEDAESMLELYVRQIPILGYNSSSFDLNVIRPYLIKRLFFNKTVADSNPKNDGDDELIEIDSHEVDHDHTSENDDENDDDDNMVDDNDDDDDDTSGFTIYHGFLDDAAVDDDEDIAFVSEMKKKKRKKRSQRYAIKNGNKFICLATEKLKFLDIMNFIAPGFTYKKYLEAHDTTEQKGYFPYDYVDSVDRLNDGLPDRK